MNALRTLVAMVAQTIMADLAVDVHKVHKQVLEGKLTFLSKFESVR